MIEEFNKQMNEKGWCVFADFVPTDLVSRMIYDIEKSYVRCRNIQIDNGIINTEFTVHHLIGQGQSFMDYLMLFEDLNKFTEEYFSGKYILNAFGGNLLRKGQSYANTIHRDIRSFSSSLPLMLNTIVMLDDFTMENGATWLMHKGHEWSDKPTESEFAKQSFQITGKSGDVVFFNSNMWHKAGENLTDKPRRSCTPMFTKPFYKQQFDYAQFCDAASSPWMKQILGWNSRVPATLNDWYQKKENRFYKGNQE